jgi:hypothetical protein
VLVESVPVDSVPLVPSAPDQPPEAAHDVASRAVQVRLEMPPLDTLVGLAVRATEGAPGVDPLTELDVAGASPEPEPPHADSPATASTAMKERLIIPAPLQQLSLGPTMTSVDVLRLNVATRLSQATRVPGKNFKTDFGKC